MAEGTGNVNKTASNLPPGDPQLIGMIVEHLKNRGLFDEKSFNASGNIVHIPVPCRWHQPAYQNLRQKVDNYVTSHLSTQDWNPSNNKNQMRNGLRQSVVQSGMLESGVDRIITQVVDPKMNHTFRPHIETAIHDFLSGDRREESTSTSNSPVMPRSCCSVSDMPVNLSALHFVVVLLLACQQVPTVEPHDVQEKQVSQAKRRLSPQSTVEIQSCLVSSGDVGCGTFQCFNNNSCEIQGLHHICLTLLHNAGRYDSQGKSFVKDALRCMALGLRQRFSCVSRRCSAVKEMVFSLQRECYSKHQLCLALRDHMDTTGNLVQFHLMFPPGPYVELVNFLLKCGDEVRSWVSRRLRGQCEQHWGALCRSFGRTCPQSDAPQHTTDPPHHHPPMYFLNVVLTTFQTDPGFQAVFLSFYLN
uniref:Stanniocalcin n=1 Tax=Scophthalmus maximus TaxID=52904 RepID=A0A8D2ZN35_SCOMX